MALDVLIVDDSSSIRKILNRVLVQTEVPLGRVHEAADGNEALEILKTEKVGLIFSDINMPNMDGIEFLTRVKADAALQIIPIVMVTTEGSNATIMLALKLGASGYVKKPFNADRIKEKLMGLI
jgi:two-component system chemotaxis response regulator CheY